MLAFSSPMQYDLETIMVVEATINKIIGKRGNATGKGNNHRTKIIKKELVSQKITQIMKTLVLEAAVSMQDQLQHKASTV